LAFPSWFFFLLSFLHSVFFGRRGKSKAVGQEIKQLPVAIAHLELKRTQQMPGSTRTHLDWNWHFDISFFSFSSQREDGAGTEQQSNRAKSKARAQDYTRRSEGAQEPARRFHPLLSAAVRRLSVLVLPKKAKPLDSKLSRQLPAYAFCIERQIVEYHHEGEAMDP
jgi:hypothetical protein